MKMEAIYIIFIIGLNVSAALSQDSLNIQDPKINNIKERIISLENEIAVLNESKYYFLGVMAISAGIYAFISAIVVTVNYIMSRRKVRELVEAEITNQIKLVDIEKKKAVDEIKNKYDKKFELIEMDNLKSTASINRAMVTVASKFPSTSLLWVMRTIEGLETIRNKEKDIEKKEKWAIETRKQLNLAITKIKSMKSGSLTNVKHYQEINKMINGIDKTEFKRELKLLTEGIDKIYNPRSNSD